jgi:hypothetical protein
VYIIFPKMKARMTRDSVSDGAGVLRGTVVFDSVVREESLPWSGRRARRILYAHVYMYVHVCRDKYVHVYM